MQGGQPTMHQATPEGAAHAGAAYAGTAHAGAAHAARMAPPSPAAAGGVIAAAAAADADGFAAFAATHTATGAAETQLGEIESLRAEIARLREDVALLKQKQKKKRGGTFHEQLLQALKTCRDDIEEASVAAHSAHKGQRAVAVIFMKATYLDEHKSLRHMQAPLTFYSPGKLREYLTDDPGRRVRLVEFRTEVDRALGYYPVVVGMAGMGQVDAGVARADEERQADGGNAVTDQEGQVAGGLVEVELPYTGIWDEHGRPKLPVESFTGDRRRNTGRSRVATCLQRLLVIQHGPAYDIPKWWSKVKEIKVPAPEVWT
ncbi:hypothetical protein FOA52_003933 [Chlamydomonas sp. UWO 241]|nr:hypothetical protein FOA52_003933 [Chlamydomonas sp. UWO 241]